MTDREAIHAYLLSKWRRSAPELNGLTLPAPGHAHDELCPLVMAGTAWSAKGPASTAPFAPEELMDRTVSGVVKPGCGWVLISLQEQQPKPLCAGSPPVTKTALILTVHYGHQLGRGPALPDAYGQAMARLLPCGWYLAVNGPEHYLRADMPPPRTPVYMGDQGGWSWSTSTHRLTRYQRG